MEDSPQISVITDKVAISSINNHNAQTIQTENPCSSSSSLSASSSSSGLSSASFNSCSIPNTFGNNTLPKSNSNPILLSAGSTASSLSPSSISPNNQVIGHNSYQLKKSPSDFENKQHYSSSNTLVNSSSTLSLIAPVHAIFGNQKPAPITSMHGINVAVETAAKKYRCAAQNSEATCCWKGKLPPKQYKTPVVYSTKVFVGGLPWDITEEDLIKEFGIFGPCRVEWTNKDRYNIYQQQQQQQNQQQGDSNFQQNQPNSFRRSLSHMQGQKQQNSENSLKQRMSPGFSYVIYESEYSVRGLVSNCIEDYQNGRDRVEYYFKISTRRVRNKEVQIIPWILADNNFALCTPKELDPKKTVFVGNLHGTMTARDLAHIMNELFGCVVYAGIDIDKLKYPIGSGRVTFSNQQNFMRAVRAAFVDIQSSKFNKRIQIDPYLEDVQCALCYSDKGIYFCRDFQCFNYYCGGCWEKQHSYGSQMGNHKPLMRKREDK